MEKSDKLLLIEAIERLQEGANYAKEGIADPEKDVYRSAMIVAKEAVAGLELIEAHRQIILAR